MQFEYSGDNAVTTQWVSFIIPGGSGDKITLSEASSDGSNTLSGYKMNEKLECPNGNAIVGVRFQSHNVLPQGVKPCS
jgi:hypothetical protein